MKTLHDKVIDYLEEHEDFSKLENSTVRDAYVHNLIALIETNLRDEASFNCGAGCKHKNVENK